MIDIYTLQEKKKLKIVHVPIIVEVQSRIAFQKSWKKWIHEEG